MGAPFKAPTDSLTRDRLREVLSYDPASGLFRWRVRTGPRSVIGGVAGTVDRKGYVRIKIDGVKHAAHRLAWLYVLSEWPADQVDHQNRDRADNRWVNLRAATAHENQMNCVSPRCSSGRLKGAYLKSGRWMAIITAYGERRYLGAFDTEELAHAAYAAAARDLHGEFARVA